jgi:type II secretory pathway component PulK
MRSFNQNEGMAILVSALCAVMLSSLVVMSLYWDLAR